MNHGRFEPFESACGPDRTPAYARPYALTRFTSILCACTSLLAWNGGCVTSGTRLAIEHIQRGDSFVEQEKLEAALTEFEAAAALEPQMAVAHSRMGVVYQQLGELAQAVECFVEAIRIEPYSFAETYKLAQVYHFMHRLPEAVRAYLHAVELKPLDFDARLNLGVCYQEMGEFEQAIEHFNKSVEINSAKPHGFVNLGVALDAQGKYYEAIRAFKEALERDSSHAEVLVNLARTYMNQDRLKLAQQALTQAIRIGPQLAAAHEALGYCLFRMREYREAERSYKRALAYEWRLPRAHVGIGSINMFDFLADSSRTRSRDRALEHWHRSLELSPDQPRIRKLIARYQPSKANPEQVLLDNSGRP